MQTLAALEGDGYKTITNVVVGDESTTTIRTTYIDANHTVPVTDDDQYFADRYYGTGKNVGVDYQGYTADVDVTLGSEAYTSISAIRGSDGTAVIYGSSAAETIYAGGGDNTINGGGGRDVLVSGNDNKYGSALFEFTAGNGKDTIIGFEAYSSRTSVTADRLTIDEGYEAKLVSGNVRLSLNSSDQLTLVDMAGEMIQINGDVSEIGNDLAYDSVVANYVGIDNATVAIGDVEEDVAMWVNLGELGWEEGAKFANVRVIDARDYYENSTLVGGSETTEIYCGHGGNTVWGGHTASNDTIYGGEGNTAMVYLYGNGNDVFEGAKDGDLVAFLNIGLEEIDWANSKFDSTALDFKLNDGGSMKINGDKEVVVQLNNGSQWTNDRQGGWNFKGMAE